MLITILFIIAPNWKQPARKTSVVHPYKRKKPAADPSNSMSVSQMPVKEARPQVTSCKIHVCDILEKAEL